MEVYIPLEDLIDFEKEIERLKKEQAKLAEELARVHAKLGNAGFLAKAPEKVISEEKEKQAKYTMMHQSVAERLASLLKKAGK